MSNPTETREPKIGTPAAVLESNTGVAAKRGPTAEDKPDEKVELLVPRVREANPGTFHKAHTTLRPSFPPKAKARTHSALVQPRKT